MNFKSLLQLPWVYWLTVALASFLLFLYPVTDADLGWHLRHGQDIWQQHTIKLPNHYSFTMPEYLWPNHSWGYDVLIYPVFQTLGFTGLSILGALLVTGSILVSLKTTGRKAAFGLIIYFYFGQHLLNNGLRSHYLSLLLFALVWYLLNHLTNQIASYLEKKLSNTPLLKDNPPRITLLVIIPLLFLLWANVHGQFIFGLAIVIMFQIFNHAQKPFIRLISVLLAAAATLINPFGFNLATTTLAHLNAPVQQFIFEWMPWELNTPRMLAFLLFSGVFWWLVYRHKTLHFNQILVLVLVNLLALKARRIIPYFLLISLPLFLSFLPHQLPKRYTQNKLLIIVILLLAIFRFPAVVNQSWDSYCQSNVACSEPAIAFLKDNQLKGTVFNAYRLGGWLIWRYPNFIPYIDGRMTLWQQQDSSYPFLTYLQVIHTQPGSRDQFRAINPDYAILHPQYPLHQAVTQAGWRQIYQDKTLTIFQNPQSPTTSAQPQ